MCIAVSEWYTWIRWYRSVHIVFLIALWVFFVLVVVLINGLHSVEYITDDLLMYSIICAHVMFYSSHYATLSPQINSMYTCKLNMTILQFRQYCFDGYNLGINY